MDEKWWRQLIGLCPGHVQRRGTQSYVWRGNFPWRFVGSQATGSRPGRVVHRKLFFLIPKSCPYSARCSAGGLLGTNGSGMIGIIGTIVSGMSRGHRLAHCEDVGRYVESFSTKGANGCWLLEFSRGQWRQPWIGGAKWVFESDLHTTWLYCLGFSGLAHGLRHGSTTSTGTTSTSFLPGNWSCCVGPLSSEMMRSTPKVVGFHHHPRCFRRWKPGRTQSMPIYARWCSGWSP